jgi:murein DD-endopeptidase MepM/ murein hydrolase activator NlpD
MKSFEELINTYADQFSKVVDFDLQTDQLLPFNFTASNPELTPELLSNTKQFSQWVADKLAENKARFGFGGYDEHRTIYSRSEHFDSGEEPRRLHLGMDIWGPAATPVHNFYEAKVHSFKFNDNFGDYGATIILQYELEGFKFFGLYGHLNLASLEGLYEGKQMGKGVQFANFGIPEENGYWPPHLHFQLIFDMQGLKGDYPGVCQFSQRDFYLNNCPDPSKILGLDKA